MIPLDREAHQPADVLINGKVVARGEVVTIDNAYGVLGIEFMAAAQALDFREFQPGKGTQCAREVIRRHVEHLHVDRPLYNDHNTMKELVKRGEILDEVEKVMGRLE